MFFLFVVIPNLNLHFLFKIPVVAIFLCIAIKLYLVQSKEIKFVTIENHNICFFTARERKRSMNISQLQFKVLNEGNLQVSSVNDNFEYTFVKNEWTNKMFMELDKLNSSNSE